MIHKTTKKTESDVDIRPQIFALNLCEKTYLPDHVRKESQVIGITQIR